MTYKVQDINAQLRYNTSQVLWLCKINKEKLVNYMDNLLNDWLVTYFGDWTPEEWKRSRLLLNWWTHNWCLRDEHILPTIYEEFPYIRLVTYRMQHQVIFNDVTDTAKFLRDDFRSLMQDFINEIKAAENPKPAAV